jgi:hypothetical protein
MYTLVVEERGARKMSQLVPAPAEDNDNDFMEVFREPLDRECVEFSVGNPRVEHITGIVHLYKRNGPPPYGAHAWRAAPGTSSSKALDAEVRARCASMGRCARGAVARVRLRSGRHSSTCSAP